MNMDASVYEFLNLDINEQWLFIMNLKSRADALGIVNYDPNNKSTEYEDILRKIHLCETLIDLELSDSIYYDNWRDKWIIREEF